MQPPDELMVHTFLPSMRLLVSKELRARGFSQNLISSMLGITQASVSHYLASKPEKAYASLASLSVSREDAARYAALLAEDSQRSPTDAVETLVSVWTDLLGRGLVCDAHRHEYPSLAQCDVCIRQFGRVPSKDTDAIEDVAQAVAIIEASGVFVNVMPQVSVNVARVAGESESPDDVVAVPGRIVKIQGRAKAMMPPAPGASGHMARVLLAARRQRPELKGVVNVKYDSRMGTVLKALKVSVVKTGNYPVGSKGDPTLDALARAMASSGKGFDALVDEGTTGIEPNVYLFGLTATEAARLALRAAVAYSPR